MISLLIQTERSGVDSGGLRGRATRKGAPTPTSRGLNKLLPSSLVELLGKSFALMLGNRLQMSVMC